MTANSDQNRPDPIDVEVGLRLRQLRLQKAMSQGDLAEKVGISFQQLQKYERGQNRISASKLVHLAHALDCSAGDLLETESGPLDADVMNIAASVRGVDQLVAAWGAIVSPDERDLVLTLAKLLSQRSLKAD